MQRTNRDVQLKISSLKKSYDNETMVLQDINLSLEAEEFLVIVGPSGCGKTTLLRMIAGLEEVTGGTITIAGRDVTHLPPAKRDIAMVFQDYALYPHMTVKDNLSFGLKMRKIPQEEIDKRIAMASRILGIDALLKRKPSQLSGGQRQRVAIGRAIVRQPSLFLFDEPLSNLDAKLRSQTRIELADLHNRLGATSIYVTHDQVEAMTLATKIIVLNQGIIQQIGAPMDLYNKPQNKFVASFIGSPAMNFLNGQLHISGQQKIFEFGSLKLDFSNAPTPETSGPYTLGLRPEALKVKTTADGRESEGPTDFELKLLLLEPHGNEAHVIGSLEDQQLILRSANPNRLKVIYQAKKDDFLPITVDREALHWFAADENGKRLV